MKKKKHGRVLRRILAVILTLLLILLAVLVFVFRDNLSEEGLRRTFGQTDELRPTEEDFAYESGTDQVFAAAGDGLAVASGSAIQLLNEKGDTVWKQVVSYGAPAVFGSEEAALFCDIGGTNAVVVYPDGESAELTPEGAIISANMNENGWFVLVTEAAGYKGVARVYNSARELQYEWWSGSGYLLRAAVSPDNKRLAAVCADSEGTKLHIFSLSSENELASAVFPEELAFDLYFLGSGTVCTISEEKLHFVGTDGEEKGVYSLGDYFLMDYDFGSESFVSLFVSAYRAGTGGLVLTLNPSGEVLGYAEVSRNVSALSARGKQLLVMTGGDLSLYGQDMSLQESKEMLVTAKKAILQPGGGILLLSAYAAEQFRF